MRAAFELRVRIIAVCVLVVACLLVARLYMVQVVYGSAYASEADKQYVQSAADHFDRGDIYFKDKNGRRVAAAGLKTGFTVAIDPTKVNDPEALYQALVKHMPLDRDDFITRASKVDDPYEEVAQRVDADVAAAIKKGRYTGVQLFRKQWRFYPGGSLASQTLGFVGYDKDGMQLTGRYGLERYWNDVLIRNQDELYVNFFAEVFSSVRDMLFENDRKRAGDIVTSIEPSVQHELERELMRTQESWHAKQLAAIIIDPASGDVIAMASLPTFDANDFSAEQSPSVFSNPLVESVREMGSIIKPIVMAIGMDTGAVHTSTTFEDTGTIKLNGYTIGNYDGRARGVVDMQQVMNQSLNVGMAFVAQQIGGKRLAEKIRAFGLGEETGIDLPFEARGLIKNLESPREVEYATAAFGQGIALTPIATARALAALGNGGYLVTPHIAQEIRYETGMVGNVSIDERVQVISKEASEEITRMLVKVVDDALLNGKAKKERYTIAAKTGTAQIAREGSRGYYDDRYLHSFFGYFPAYDPKFLIFMYHVEPQGARYASETLTQPFMNLVDFLINYYEIPPDR